MTGPAHKALDALATNWEQRSHASHPSDAMLINLHIRELRELLAGQDFMASSEAVWRTMDCCPINTDVLLWNDATEEISIGHKAEDAPSDDAVISGMTASWADAWMPLPPQPESATHDPDGPCLKLATQPEAKR